MDKHINHTTAVLKGLLGKIEPYPKSQFLSVCGPAGKKIKEAFMKGYVLGEKMRNGNIAILIKKAIEEENEKTT